MPDDEGVTKKGLVLPAAEDGGFDAIPWNGEGACNEEGAPRLRLEQKDNTEREINVKIVSYVNGTRYTSLERWI